MGEGGATVVLKRAKHRIGVDLVARGRQIASAANVDHADIATKVVTKRDYGAIVGVEDVRAYTAAGGGDVLQDSAPNCQRRAPFVVDADAGVIAEGTVDDSKGRVAGVGTIPDAAAVEGRVAAQGAISDLQRCAAQVSVVEDAAAGMGRVAAEDAIAYSQRRVVVIDTAAAVAVRKA